MSDSIIRVENLGKRYFLSHQSQELAKYVTLRDAIANSISSIFNPKLHLNQKKEEFWALKDVSFDIKQGEAVGIIGRNGAGKSTLLKLLSRITEPSTGRITLKGRVASLLEVGTGFHPELTGRENIYLNGAILGMSRLEIRRKFDEIVAFAEVERFLDTPVKRYSSGMYVRLAFAVAAHLEPEILVVDEVLAVGDAAFQKKCLGKMGDVAREEGRTVLFVSHNMTAVKTLCSQGIWLNQGQLKLLDNVDKVIQCYLKSGEVNNREKIWYDINTAPGNDKAKLISIRIIDQQGSTEAQFLLDQPVILEVIYQVLMENTRLNLSCSLFSQEGVHIFASSSTTDKTWFNKEHHRGYFRSLCTIPKNFLNEGIYDVTMLLVENSNFVLAQADHVVSFEMIDPGTNRHGWFGKWTGLIRPLLDWNTEILQQSKLEK